MEHNPNTLLQMKQYAPHLTSLNYRTSISSVFSLMIFVNDLTLFIQLVFSDQDLSL